MPLVYLTINSYIVHLVAKLQANGVASILCHLVIYTTLSFSGKTSHKILEVVYGFLYPFSQKSICKVRL